MREKTAKKSLRIELAAIMAIVQDHGIEALLDDLIACWAGWEDSSFYVDLLAPAIVRRDDAFRLLPAEEQAALRLQQRLTLDEWVNLPSLLKQRMDQLKTDKEQKERERRDRPRLLREQREMEEREAQAREDLKASRALEALQRKNEMKKRAHEVRSRMMAVLTSDFLGVDQAHAEDSDSEFLTIQELITLKRDFVVDWAKRELNLTLDEEQALAVATFGGDVLVTARAGSGKTRVLVTRAIFLIRHCRLNPNELLLLAFNRKAAEEMQSRISESVPGAVPHVMTFHALAYGLVNPEEELVYDNIETNSEARSRVVQNIVDECIVDPNFGPRIREVMLEHFRTDWETIAAGGFDLSMSDYIRNRRALTSETLNGEYVKSYGEKLIANTLFENGIEYRYERNIRWDGHNYRPDFSIVTGEDTGVIIEYFGMMGDPDYDDQAQAKREFWQARLGWTLIELTRANINLPLASFNDNLLTALAECGISAKPLTEEEIWSTIKNRAIDRFTGALATFVSRCRKQGLNETSLSELKNSHVTLTNFEATFLDIGCSVYRSYLGRLQETGQEDFDGLMWRAIDSLNHGQTRFARKQGREVGDLKRIRHVLIDEFQDFSQMFYKIAMGVRISSPSVQFFCVGDDWQAINAFAGSERRFFFDFDRYFNNTLALDVKRNYRSPKSVVDTGNSLMAHQGPQAIANQKEPGVVLSCDLGAFVATATEEARHQGDIITPAVLRLIHRCLQRGEDVVLLARRNHVPGYVRYDERLPQMQAGLERFLANIKSYFPLEDHHRISISTTHKYKGLEKAAVVVVDAKAGSYPLIHPSWIFMRIFGDTVEKLEADERRLFYVALTRATKVLLLLTDSMAESPFLTEIRARTTLKTLDWSNLSPVSSLDSPRLEIRIFNGYEVRETLKQQGYRYNAQIKTWYRTVDAETFESATIKNQVWFVPSVRVEIFNEEGLLVDNLQA